MIFCTLAPAAGGRGEKPCQLPPSRRFLFARRGFCGPSSFPTKSTIAAMTPVSRSNRLWPSPSVVSNFASPGHCSTRLTLSRYGSVPVGRVVGDQQRGVTGVRRHPDQLEFFDGKPTRSWMRAAIRSRVRLPRLRASAKVSS